MFTINFFFVFFVAILFALLAYAFIRKRLGNLVWGIAYCVLSLIALCFIQPDSKDYLENPNDYKPSTIFVKDITFIQQKPDKLLLTSDTNKQYVVDNKEYIEKNQPYTLPAAKHYVPVLDYILFMIFLSLFSILTIAFFNK